MPARAKRLYLTRPEPTEAMVLAACLQLLSRHPRVAWAKRLNTGLAMLPGRGGKPQPVRFGWTGAPDIIGQLKTGQLLAVECKRPSGRVQPEQTAFLVLVAANGGRAGVVRSVDDLEGLLRNLNSALPLVIDLPRPELAANPF